MLGKTNGCQLAKGYVNQCIVYMLKPHIVNASHELNAVIRPKANSNNLISVYKN